MPKKISTIKCADCFKSLGIPARIEMYHYLRDNGEATVTRLVELVGLTQPTVSYHLKEMKELGLVNNRKSGKEVYYSINELCPIHQRDCVLNIVRFPGEEL